MTHTTKHTPGPWFYNYDDHCIVNQAGVSIVNVRGAMSGNDTNADIALIAAAPAMYEALLWAKQYLRMPNFHHDNSYNADQWAGDYNKLCEALAQAEGK